MLSDLLDIQSARILIIDDEDIYLDMLSAILHTQGYWNLTTFQSPRNAVEYYWTHKPDLVLLDFLMPELSGLEVLRLLQKEPYYPDPPVLVMTADASHETRLKCLGAGAKDFMRKPLDNAELLLRIKNLLLMHLGHKESIQHNGTLDNLIQHRTHELLKTQNEILERLGIASEFRDTDTHFHTQRVGQFAGCLAKTFGFNNDIVDEISITAPLHDIGKIGVPDHVLLKPGRLDAEEWEIMKLHTIHGQNILKGSDSSLLKAAEVIALTHHERWDGLGYPQGLMGGETHIYGRITAIADVYDALTMPRPYKPAWRHEQATAYIIDGGGNQFDPELVEVFSTVQDQFVAISNQWPDI